MRATRRGGEEEAPAVSGVERAGELVNQFFKANSGGVQSFRFTVAPEVFSLNVLSAIRWTKCCGPDAECDPLGQGRIDEVLHEAVRRARSAGYDPDAYERLVVAFPRCEQFDFEGMAENLDKGVWMNGFPTLGSFATVLAHELGHTNGAEHEEFGEFEYGNVFSVMGMGALPSAHFSVGLKAAFGWISGNQVVTLGAAHSAACASDPACTPGRGGTFSLSAVDAGSYPRSKVFGLRIHLEEPSTVLWVSFREQRRFSSTEELGAAFEEVEVAHRGALLTWSYEQGLAQHDSQRSPPEMVAASKGQGAGAGAGLGPVAAGGIGEYGPSQLVPYIAQSVGEGHFLDAARTAPIPEGGVYVYDLDHVGARIHVTGYSKSKKTLQVDVRFVARSGERDYATDGPLAVDGGYGCSAVGDRAPLDARAVSQRAADGYHLFQVRTDGQPSLLSIQACVPEGGADQKSNSAGRASAGVYVYDSYPLQLAKAAGAGGQSSRSSVDVDMDPRVGAVHFERLRSCGDRAECPVRLSLNDEWFDGEWRVDWTDHAPVRRYWRQNDLGSMLYLIYDTEDRAWRLFDADDMAYPWVTIKAKAPGKAASAADTDGHVPLGELSRVGGIVARDDGGGVIRRASVACSERRSVRILPEVSPSYPDTVVYRAGVRNASYVLFYDGPKGAGAPPPRVAQTTVTCEATQCGAGEWLNRNRGECAKCPPSRPASLPGSRDQAACFQDCDVVAVSGLKGKPRSAANGRYVRRGIHDGRAFYQRVPRGSGSGSGSGAGADGGGDLFLFSVWANEYWSVSPVLGDVESEVWTSAGTTHPTQIKAKGVKVACVAPTAAPTTAAPTTAAAVAGMCARQRSKARCRRQKACAYSRASKPRCFARPAAATAPPTPRPCEKLGKRACRRAAECAYFASAAKTRRCRAKQSVANFNSS